MCCPPIVSNFLLAAHTLSLAVQAADLKGGKAKASDAAAGLDGMTSDVAAATRDAGGEVVDAAPVDNDKCVALQQHNMHYSSMFHATRSSSKS